MVMIGRRRRPPSSSLGLIMHRLLLLLLLLASMVPKSLATVCPPSSVCVHHRTESRESPCTVCAWSEEPPAFLDQHWPSQLVYDLYNRCDEFSCRDFEVFVVSWIKWSTSGKLVCRVHTFARGQYSGWEERNSLASGIITFAGENGGWWDRGGWNAWSAIHSRTVAGGKMSFHLQTECHIM